MFGPAVGPAEADADRALGDFRRHAHRGQHMASGRTLPDEQAAPALTMIAGEIERDHLGFAGNAGHGDADRVRQARRILRQMTGAPARLP